VRFAKQLSRCLTVVEETVLAGGILCLATLTVLNVLARTFLGYSLAAAEEISQFALIAVTFVGLSYAAAQGRHIRMTAFYDAVPKPGRKHLRLGICVFTAALLLYLDVYAVSYVLTVKALGSVSPVLQAPLWTVYLAAPFGLSLAALQYCLAAWRNLRSKDEIYLAYGVPDVYLPPMDGI
jgi:TRAP-type C4-dicarboxylate transport system permease small subunit